MKNVEAQGSQTHHLKKLRRRSLKEFKYFNHPPLKKLEDYKDKLYITTAQAKNVSGHLDDDFVFGSPTK